MNTNKPMQPMPPARDMKPRRPAAPRREVVSPEEQAKRAAMLQEVQDEKAGRAAGEAYDKAMPAPFKKGGSVGSASKRADGIATQGKTRGKVI